MHETIENMENSKLISIIEMRVVYRECTVIVFILLLQDTHVQRSCEQLKY